MKKLILLLFILQVKYNSQAQNIPGVQTPCTAASQVVSGNFVISFTIGEMPLIQSWKTNSLFITQGILQPLVAGILQPLQKVPDITSTYFSQTEVKVYPNPTPGIFSIQLNLAKKGKVKTNLFDADGKLIQSDEFEYNKFINKQYNISGLASGTYFLHLFFTETGSGRVKEYIYPFQKIN